MWHHDGSLRRPRRRSRAVKRRRRPAPSVSASPTRRTWGSGAEVVEQADRVISLTSTASRSASSSRDEAGACGGRERRGVVAVEGALVVQHPASLGHTGLAWPVILVGRAPAGAFRTHAGRASDRMSQWQPRASAAVRDERPGAPSRGPALLGLSLGVTLAIVAWGYLVFAAIDFGNAARSGDGGAWWFLALASRRRRGLPVHRPDPGRPAARRALAPRGCRSATPAASGGRRAAR